MAIKTFKRYEKKYLIEASKYEVFTQRLNEYMDYDPFCQNGSVYQIFNIYYDTKNQDIIRHSTSSPYYKEKMRLRSYHVVESGDDIVFLELKKKVKGIVLKRRVVLTFDEVTEFLNEKKRPDDCDYMKKQVLDELEYYISTYEVEPKVYISYERSALFCKQDPNFRLTFDKNIITRRDELSLANQCYGDKILSDDMYLMEVKILGAIPYWFASLLSEYDIYSTGFSKYGKEFEKTLDLCMHENII